VEPERLHAVVRGEVQGVGFRFFLIRHAEALGLHGWVRNRDDGAVEFVAEGFRAALEQLLQSAREGPRMARVTRVDADWSPAAGGLDRFDITG
jgi:acylphosphatase